MQPLDSLEIKLCQAQAKLFEASIDKTAYSSPIFIRRFMHSSVAKSFDARSFLFTNESDNDVFKTLEDEFGESHYGQEKYRPDQMFWIGYAYRCLCLKYRLSSKAVYKLFGARDILKYYNIGHTFDIVAAAERMMENIGYDDSSIGLKAYNTMKRLICLERLKEYLDTTVKVIIDTPIGQKGDGFAYPINRGHIECLKATNIQHEAYVIGHNKTKKIAQGKAIAIINAKDEGKIALVVSCSKKKYTRKEILKLMSFQEKREKGHKSKIVMAV